MQGTIRFVLGLFMVFAGAGTSDAGGPLTTVIAISLAGLAMMAWGISAMKMED